MANQQQQWNGEYIDIADDDGKSMNFCYFYLFILNKKKC